MWSPRAQCDKYRFSQQWRMELEHTDGLDLFADTVTEVLVRDGAVQGVRTSLGVEAWGDAVVLTNGTFLGGVIHIGEKHFGGGRISEPSAEGLTGSLVALGFEAGRMKTGTPPRIDARSLDFSRMIPQEGDPVPGRFRFRILRRSNTRSGVGWLIRIPRCTPFCVRASTVHRFLPGASGGGSSVLSFGGGQDQPFCGKDFASFVRRTGRTGAGRDVHQRVFDVAARGYSDTRPAKSRGF